MPRLVGLLSWYQERPSWLSACISTYAQAGITHLIAIDGAYALFPDAHARSTNLEHEAIVETCVGLGLHLNLVIPSQPWAGNEIEKRTALFRHADAITQPDTDWLIVIDADEIVTTAHEGWLDKTIASGLDAADALMWERDPNDTPVKAQVERIQHVEPRVQFTIRKVFRAIHGIHCAGNHSTYVTPDGRRLWASRKPVAEGCDLTTDLVIEHRTKYRTMHRHQQSHAYYDIRKATGAEDE